MDKISLDSLKVLSVKAEELASRYDVEKGVYEELYREHEKVHQFIEINPGQFISKKEHNEALCLSSYIIICLLARINEINESHNL